MKNQVYKKEKDSGSIAILTVIFLTAVLAMGAFATDFAVLYAEKSNLQNAVDSSVLAAAQDLPDNPLSAQMTALEYASQNHTTLSSLDITNNNKEIHVSAQKDTPLFLARILGRTSSMVSAQATAAVLPVRSLTGVAPLSITMRDFVYGQEYTLKNDAQEGVTGWYSPIRLDGSGASDYADALAYGNTTPLAVGQVLQTETGNMSGPTRSGLDTRLGLDSRVPRNTFENHDSFAPEIVYIPIVEVVSRQGTSIQEVRIVGFAAFFIENVAQQGNQCSISGRFLKTVASLGQETSPLTSDGDDSLYDYGIYSIKLMN